MNYEKLTHQNQGGSSPWYLWIFEVVLGAGLLAIALMLYITWAVYDTLSATISNFSFRSGWWLNETPAVLGILLFAVVSTVAWIIFIGLFGRNKPIFYSVLVGLCLAFTASKYYVRDTQLVKNYLCSDDPERGFYIHNKPKGLFKKNEICPQVADDDIYLAKAIADGVKPTKLPHDLNYVESLPLSENGRPTIFASTIANSEGYYDLYSGPGIGGKHTTQTPDKLVPATQGHKDLFIRFLKKGKLSVLKERLNIAEKELQDLRFKHANMPDQIPPAEATSGKVITIPYGYRANTGKGIVESGNTIKASCTAGNIFLQPFADAFCKGWVTFKKDEVFLAQIETQKRSEVDSIRSEISGLEKK